MVAASDVQKEDDGTFQQVFVTLSGMDFMPGSLSQVALMHHIGVETRQEIPDFLSRVKR